MNPARLPRLLRDQSLSALAAGLVTVLVGFASSVAIVFQAAQALGATPAQTASWMWALGIGMGATCIGLSLRWKMPVVTAWSTPGAAVLVAGAAGVSMDEAVAGFILAAVLVGGLGAGALAGALAGASGPVASFMLLIVAPRGDAARPRGAAGSLSRSVRPAL